MYAHRHYFWHRLGLYYQHFYDYFLHQKSQLRDGTTVGTRPLRACPQAPWLQSGRRSNVGRSKISMESELRALSRWKKKCSPCLASRSLCCRQSCHRLHSADLSPMVLGSPVSIYSDSGDDSRGDGDSSEDCLSVMMRGQGPGVIVTIFLR